MTKMHRILVYVEPHPIRDTYEEFHSAGALLARAMVRRSAEIDFKIISNNQVVSYISERTPEATAHCVRLTDAETASIAKFDGIWNEERIAIWLELTKGLGEACGLYESILDRLYEEWPFDGVLLWAENGAVRNFAKRHGLYVIHGELGATRSPFPSTIYLDPDGTNGNAAILSAPLEEIVPDQNVLPATTWRELAAAEENDSEVIGLEDAGLTLVAGDQKLPREPYVFIPLQLADDLNLLAHSEFTSPQNMLERVVPTMLGQGYKVVIKGHPAAPLRSFNLIAETRALSFAAKHEGVTIVPRTASSRQTINAIQQASGVITVNSSVGFEALLLGKKVVTIGKAVYDIGGKLQRSISDLGRFDEIVLDQKWIDRLATFLCMHYFVPQRYVANGLAILTAIELLRTKRQRDRLFWQDWVQHMNFGRDIILQQSMPLALQSGNVVRRGISDQDFWEITGHRVSLTKERASIVIPSIVGVLEATPRLVPKMFTGHIDEIAFANDRGEGVVSGWAAVAKSKEPPLAVMLIHDGNVIDFKKPLALRPDVAKHLGMPTADYGFRFKSPRIRKGEIDKMAMIFVSGDERAEAARLEIQPGKSGFLSPSI